MDINHKMIKIKKERDYERLNQILEMWDYRLKRVYELIDYVYIEDNHYVIYLKINQKIINKHDEGSNLSQLCKKPYKDIDGLKHIVNQWYEYHKNMERIEYDDQYQSYYQAYAKGEVSDNDKEEYRFYLPESIQTEPNHHQSKTRKKYLGFFIIMASFIILSSWIESITKIPSLVSYGFIFLVLLAGAYYFVFHIRSSENSKQDLTYKQNSTDYHELTRMMNNFIVTEDNDVFRVYELVRNYNERNHCLIARTPSPLNYIFNDDKDDALHQVLRDITDEPKTVGDVQDMLNALQEASYSKTEQRIINMFQNRYLNELEAIEHTLLETLSRKDTIARLETHIDVLKTIQNRINKFQTEIHEPSEDLNMLSYEVQTSIDQYKWTMYKTANAS